jgi:hypothetical protein
MTGQGVMAQPAVWSSTRVLMNAFIGETAVSWYKR